MASPLFVIDGVRTPFCKHVAGATLGQAAERLAREWRIARETQDEFALRSHRPAAAARPRLAEERWPAYPRGQDTPAPVVDDNGGRDDESLEALAKQRPAFDRRDGTVTEGNASPIAGGAVALLAMNEAWLEAA